MDSKEKVIKNDKKSNLLDEIPSSKLTKEKASYNRMKHGLGFCCEKHKWCRGLETIYGDY